MWKKRVIAVCLIVSLVTAVLPGAEGHIVSAAATADSQYIDKGSCGANITYVLGNDGVLSIAGEGEMANYTLPEKVPWFENRQFIKAVVFSEGSDVKNISAHSFEYCSNLTSITVPDSVTGIGASAFRGCGRLAEVKLPEGLTSIGASAFLGCSALKTIVIPDSVESIGEEAFKDSGVDASEIDFRRGRCGENLSWALRGDYRLYITGTGAMTDYSSASAPWYEFRDKITEISISPDMTQIGDYAFEKCTKISEVPLPEKAVRIGRCAFSGCSGISEVQIHKKITEIADYAFSQSGLKEVLIDGDTPVTLGGHVFENCVNLQNVTLPATQDKLGAYMFSGCKTLGGTFVLPGKLTEIGDGALQNCTGITGITLPDTLKKIGARAFEKCTAVQDIVVNDSVTEIGEGAFSGCSGLKRMTLPFAGGNPGTEEASESSEEKLKQNLFGYIFGTTSYTGGSKTTQSYSDSGKVTYYLPDSLTDVTITGGMLKYGAFDQCKNLKHIRFMGEGSEIAQYVYRGCTGLTEVEIGSHITAIREGAFSGCSGLTGLSLPDSIQTVESGAFSECTELVTVKLPKNMMEIPDRLFRGCKKLQKICMSDGITRIGEYAFENCEVLEGGKLPDILTEIGRGAWKNATSIRELHLPSGVTTLDDEVFMGCAGLQEVLLPEGITAIGNQTFSGCVGLQSLSLPKGLETIGASALKDCEKLETVAVPESVKTIGSGAFSGCGSLKSITLPFIGASADAVTSTETALFGYVFGTTKYTGGTDTKQSYAKGTKNYYIPASLQTVTVTGGSVFYGSFYNCSGLKKITLPEKATAIGDFAFYNCTGLSEISLPEGLTEIGGKAFQNCSGLTALTLPDKVETIGVNAFQGCTGLTSFVLPEQVTGVANYLFSGCSNLKQITLPKQLNQIGEYAFQNCTAVTEFTVPDSVTVVGKGAFSGCSSLEQMTLPFVGAKADATTASANTVLGYIFGGTSYSGGIKTAQSYSSSSMTYYIPASLRRITVTKGPVLSGSFCNCSELTEIRLPEGMTEIGNKVFQNCSGLTSLTLPDKVGTIGSEAFRDCTGLTGIRLPEQLKEIKNNAFQNCTGLTSITVPDSVTAIGKSAFSGCSRLANMVLPFVGANNTLTKPSSQSVLGYIFGNTAYDGGVKTRQYYSGSYVDNYIPSSLRTVQVTGGAILRGAFYECNGLTSVLLPDDLKVIERNAFYNCAALTQITVPTEVTEVQENAFYNCAAMKAVTFLGSAPAIDAKAFTQVEATVYYPKTDPSWSACVGNQYGGTLTWEAHTHQYTTSVVAPACTTKGYTIHQCSNCKSYYMDDYVSETGHKAEIDAAVPADCMREGLTEGSHCSVCGEVLVAQKASKKVPHQFINYTSNRDATYDADGTKTAQCEYGCGTKDTVKETGSKLVDTTQPLLTVTIGTNSWKTLLNTVTFGLFFQKTQTVTIQASDEELLPDGSRTDRLDKVYYSISDRKIDVNELEKLNWTEYRKPVPLNPGKPYVVYAKAVDKSGNTTYAGTDGVIVDNEFPTVEGITDGQSYCESVTFSVSDLSLASVMDNGTVIEPKGDLYVIAGDDKKHTVIAKDNCGNEISLAVTVYQGHMWSEYVYNQDVTCTTSGTKTAECAYGCGSTNTVIDEMHPPAGHRYGKPEFVWTEDSRSARAHFVCETDKTHTSETDCVVTAVSEDATCTTRGEVVYTATVGNNGKSWNDTKHVSGVALGHEYEAVFHWADDVSKCTADLVCQRAGCTQATAGHEKKGVTCTIETKVTPAACIQEGMTETIAVAEADGVKYTDTGKKEKLPVDGENHVHTQIVNRREATCHYAGYTGDVYCNDCKVRVKLGEHLEKTSHTWDSGEIKKEATEEEIGIIIYTCPICGEKRVEAIPTIEKDPGTDPENPSQTPATSQTPPVQSPNPQSPLPQTPSPGTPEETVIPTAMPTAIPPVSGTQHPGQSQTTNQPQTPGQPATSVPGMTPVPGTTPPAKGTMLTDQKNGTVYQVTGTQTVCFMTQSGASGTVKVQETITLGGCTYQITGIAAKAFKGNKKIKKVIIGSQIKTIGRQAFYGCRNLKSVVIRSKKLTKRTVGSKAFAKIHKKAVVKVPREKVKNYRKILKKRGVNGKKQKIRK